VFGKPKTSAQPNPVIDPTIEAEDFENLLADEYRSLRAGYSSPLVVRVSNARLTVALLTSEIPKIRDGEEAVRLLAIPSGNRSERRLEELIRMKRVSENAKEAVFAAALPLIRAVASKEWRRRQQWGSQVPLEDLIQEATLGLLKGLAAFKSDAMGRSATNYLGQWMLVEMRRSSEVMDHDLQVGHDAGERFRKIRALRSRLLHDLAREPSDEEIAEASRNPQYVTRPNMLGKAPVEGGEEPSLGKGVTPTQVAEERAARTRVGHAVRFDAAYGDESGANPTAGVVDPDRITINSGLVDHGTDPAELVANEASQQVIAALVAQVIQKIQMPDEQRDIIARRYRLNPYVEEMSAREISRTTGVHRERVTRILRAFSLEVSKKGGHFHKAISKLSTEDLYAVGLQWIVDALGPWDNTVKTIKPASRILTEDRSQKKHTPLPAGDTTRSGVLIWYKCAYHGQRFSTLYEPGVRPAQNKACPQCGNVATIET